MSNAAEERMKAQQRASINRQIRNVQGYLRELQTQKTDLKKKIERLTKALTTVRSNEISLQSGINSLSTMQIESGSWKGENATKANIELEQMKTSAQTISRKVADAVEQMQEDKAKLERKLETIENTIGSQNRILSNLYSQLAGL